MNPSSHPGSLSKRLQTKLTFSLQPRLSPERVNSIITSFSISENLYHTGDEFSFKDPIFLSNVYKTQREKILSFLYGEIISSLQEIKDYADANLSLHPYNQVTYNIEQKLSRMIVILKNL